MLHAMSLPGAPLVDVLGGARPSARVAVVRPDDVAIARMAAEHLEKQGFRRLGYVGSAGDVCSERRLEALRGWSSERGRSLQVCLPSRPPSLEALAAWVKNLPKPCGIILCGDHLGLIMQEASRLAGVGAPEEVAFVGADNDGVVCELCHPTLSSVETDWEEVGFQAAAALEAMMAGAPAPAVPVLIPPRGMVVRGSSDVQAVDDAVVATALRIIRERSCAGLDVGSLTDELPVSRSVLQRRFRSLLGRSVHDEIMAVRLKRATELLETTSLTCGKIAEITGFRYQEYLGAVFKSHTGKTPKSHREEYRLHEGR